MGFKDILDWLRANDMGDLAIKVAEMGIDDMDSLRATDITIFQEHGLDNLSTRRIWESLHGPDILVIHETETATNRHDLPVVHARNRGSMKRALDRTITNDEDQLIIDLENDMYAQSSKKPREALWKTWCIMASAWNLPPVPLTEELILKVGASFKAGQYRSPQNYFSRAIQEHRSLTKANPSYFLQQLIKNTTRSIVRGMGPTPFKDSFEIELLCRICPYNLPTGQETWIEDPAAKIDATLILLLVAAPRHRSGSSDNITRLAPDDSHRTHNIPDIASPENRLSRCLCRPRTLLHLPISQAFPPHMSTSRDEETPRQDAQEISSPVPTSTRHAAYTQCIGPHHLTGPVDPDLSGHHPVDRNHHGTTRPSRWPQTAILTTHMPCVRSTIPYQIGLFTWSSPTHWPMGIRRHQTLHPRSPITASTRSQPTGSSTQRDDQPTSPDPSPKRGPSPPTPVLDLQPHDQGMPRTSSARNMHWQCPLGDTLRMELRNIPLPQTDHQTHGTLLRQVQVPGQHQRDWPGLRGRQLRDPS